MFHPFAAFPFPTIRDVATYVKFSDLYNRNIDVMVLVMASSSASAIEEFLAEPRNVVVAGIRKDGRPHLSPNWFLWDGEKFYVSTTRPRVKYKIFSRDQRVELLVDDATGHRYVQLAGTVEIREDVKPEL